MLPRKDEGANKYFIASILLFYEGLKFTYFRWCRNGPSNFQTHLMLLVIGVCGLYQLSFLYAEKYAEMECEESSIEVVDTTSVEIEKAEVKTYGVYAAMMHMIKYKEGFVPTSYDCPAGYQTIGYGYNHESRGKTPAMKDGKMDINEASAQLKRDIEQACIEVKHMYPKLNPHQVLAMASLGYNIRGGTMGLRYNKGDRKRGITSLDAYLIKGKLPPAIKNLKFGTKYRSTKTGKMVSSPALVAARKMEIAAFEGDTAYLFKHGKRYRELVLKRDYGIKK
jgi:GH24 family phage-related lysozyme (muramidase)